MIYYLLWYHSRLRTILGVFDSTCLLMEQKEAAGPYVAQALLPLMMDTKKAIGAVILGKTIRPK